MNKLFTLLYGSTLFCRLLFLLFLSGISTLTAFSQVTRYVSTTGTNSNPASATSWATSTTNLQGAIAASSVNDQVWVAGGTYKPGGNGNSNRSLSFAMKNGLIIYGGFAGTETTLGQRPTINPTNPSATTLSGDVGILGNPTDNSFHVISNPAGLTTTAQLNGFVITDGNTSGVFPDYYGGGIYNNGSGAGNFCSPKIVNCVFVNNAASEGGALYNNGNGGGNSNAQIINCVFLNNTATSFGGAAINDGGSGGTNNSRFTNCIFFNNSAPTGSGGAVYNFGGAGSSTPQLINCGFQGNVAGNGGAMYNDGSNAGMSNPQLTNCSFQSNSAANGGGLYNNGMGGGTSTPQFTNCVFFGNGGADTFVNNLAGGASASYSLFEPSVTGYASVTGNITTSTSPFSSTAGLQLAICSPAVNAGDPASTTATVSLTDLAGNPRFYANTGTPAARIDIGAYEVQTFPTVAITSQPAANSVGCVGGTVTTFVSVSGTALSFQWYKSGTAVVGQTSATLTLTNLQPGSAGSYSVAITGNCNSLTSNVFVLSVKPVPARLYVKPSLTANANQSGLSWADAFPDLQWALNYSCTNNLNEIWVANGLYKPTSTTERTVSFAMKPNVAIYGSFLGSETDLSERVITYPSGTTLSGDIGAADTADNSYHVISNPVGLTNNAILDGFLITGGNANDATSPNNNGGGMLNTSSSPTIRNCTFCANSATQGGGLYNGSSNPKLINCAFLSNVAANGGAIFNANSSPQLTNCSLQNNSATSGGAVANTTGSGPQLVNCVLFNNGAGNTFSNNSATVTAQYNLFEPLVTGYSSGPGNLTATLSPFVSATGVQLRNGSPAVNAGDPASTSATVGITDIAGNSRFFANAGTPGRIDMGAYELQEVLEIYTLKNGNWNDSTVWSVERLPQLSERVRLKHLVTIPASFLALSGTLIFDPGSKLMYDTAGRLQLGQ